MTQTANASVSAASEGSGNAKGTVVTRFAPSPSGHLHVGGAPYRAFLLGVRARARREVRAAHRGHRPEALERRRQRGLPEGSRVARHRLGRRPRVQRRVDRRRRPARPVLPVGAARPLQPRDRAPDRRREGLLRLRHRRRTRREAKGRAGREAAVSLRPHALASLSKDDRRGEARGGRARGRPLQDSGPGRSPFRTRSWAP
jgi:hypothetical protein